MPMYEYGCEQCDHITTKLRPMTEHQEPTHCDACGSLAQRIISIPRLNLMRAETRKAHQINERSAHDPQVKQKHVCHSGCGHEAKPALKAPTSQKRPWMLGH